MRVAAGVGDPERPPHGSHARPTVGARAPMSSDDPTGQKARHDDDAPTTISFDASATLRGVYDQTRLEVGE